jgi:hypothetical protein
MALRRRFPWARGRTNRNIEDLSRRDVETLLSEMIEQPVEGQVVHAMWREPFGAEIYAVYEDDSPRRRRHGVIACGPMDRPPFRWLLTKSSCQMERACRR